jgi:hypothetical protein
MVERGVGRLLSLLSARRGESDPGTARAEVVGQRRHVITVVSGARGVGERKGHGQVGPRVRE